VRLGVLLGSGETRVAEQFLDGAKVGAVLQQVSREGMAEAVWVHGVIAADPTCVELDDAADAAVRQRRP